MPISSTSKTLARGLGKVRSGSPSIGIHELIEASKRKGFADRMKKAVSEDEALEAAKMLSQTPKSRVRRYAESGLIGGAANPVLRAAGRGVEAFVGAPKGTGTWRAGFARAALKNIDRGQFARQLTEGALAGGGVEAIREGVQLGKAKKTVKQFISERSKQSGVEPAPQSRGIPKRKPTDPWRYDPRPAGEF